MCGKPAWLVLWASYRARKHHESIASRDVTILEPSTASSRARSWGENYPNLNTTEKKALNFQNNLTFPPLKENKNCQDHWGPQELYFPISHKRHLQCNWTPAMQLCHSWFLQNRLWDDSLWASFQSHIIRKNPFFLSSTSASQQLKNW